MRLLRAREKATMFCANCGNNIIPGEKFCGNCGASVSYGNNVEQSQPTEVMQPTGVEQPTDCLLYTSPSQRDS